MKLGIEGKLAVITGGAGGMGLATARLLQEEGAKILLTDRDPQKLHKGARALKGEVASVPADLTKKDDVARVAHAAADLGGAAILVHTAGVTGAKGDPLELDDAAYLEAWDTDFMTAVRMSRALVPQMLKRAWGRVVFVTSENAAQPYPDEAVYNAAKAALLNFTKCVSTPYAPKGVLFNTVSPAFIETPMTDGMMEQRAKKLGVSMKEAVQSFLVEERPFLALARRGRPEEVAPVIALLCSELASFTVGSAYRVDGGSVSTMNL